MEKKYLISIIKMLGIIFSLFGMVWLILSIFIFTKNKTMISPFRIINDKPGTIVSFAMVFISLIASVLISIAFL